ncbi:MAG: 6-carboxytetrahydropterin synthase [Bacteroidales bacterium]|jgi:6-pyruvoyl tetrahydropterin synthase/QueD family protein|nr:6-carboxytetrahydropterin synthase [Bacteroidales bacterium]
MSLIRISKEFHFEMAHVLDGYDGLCAYVHGHSYTLIITVMGPPNNDIISPKNGMVMDFGILKDIVNKHIINSFDHSLVVNQKANWIEQVQDIDSFSRIIKLPFQPTSENLLLHFIDIIDKQLPDNVKLVHALLRETDSSYAEWFYDDNN